MGVLPSDKRALMSGGGLAVVRCVMIPRTRLVSRSLSLSISLIVISIVLSLVIGMVVRIRVTTWLLLVRCFRLRPSRCSGVGRLVKGVLPCSVLGPCLTSGRQRR